MAHMYVEMPEDVAEWIMEEAEREGCDVGPVIACLASMGLAEFGGARKSIKHVDLAWSWFKLSVRLAGRIPMTGASTGEEELPC